MPGRVSASLSILCLALVGAVTVGAAGSARGAGTAEAVRSESELANGCFAIRSAASGAYVTASGADGYAADADAADATPFFLKPTGPGRQMLRDSDGMLAVARGRDAVGREHSPSAIAEWVPDKARGSAFRIGSAANDSQLSLAREGEALVLASRAGRRGLFRLLGAEGCDRFPEARVGARGPSFKAGPGSGVQGFADLHLHITADHRAGGEVIHGESFNRFGIAEALGGDEETHGPDGSLDVTGNLLRSGLPFGTHETPGWPAFTGWPVHDTITHQQVYYRWLQRAWKAGLRLAVAQAIEDEPLCRLQPRKSHTCSETPAVELQIRALRELEKYVDAQAGGPGRGWFRLVEGPGEARRVIRRGKLAVVIGIESSSPFGCSEYRGEPQCSREDVDRGIERIHRLGVRSLFLAHWVNNAFAGAALQGGDQGAFINVFNKLQTGRYFRTGPCPKRGQGVEMRSLTPFEFQVLAGFFPLLDTLVSEAFPSYPPGRQCNAKGLTPLGRYAIRKLMASGILIETDHLSERARARVLSIARRRDYPLVSSHTGTGGEWTPGQFRKLYRAGGIATATPEATPELAEKIVGLGPDRDRERPFGAPLGTDTGGFNSLPGPPEGEEAGLSYPFRSHDGAVTFRRQRTGERIFDYNADGVAHYGLFPDLLAAMEQEEHGERAGEALFRSAEAYLRSWRRARR